MFNSAIGDVYEIEPWYRQSIGAAEATGYVADLRAAAGRGDLTGKYLGIPFNWNLAPFHEGTGVDWPGKFRMIDPRFPYLDLVADYTSGGVVLYWHEPNPASIVVLAAAGKLLVPSRKLFRPRNWMPGQRARRPAYLMSWNQACGYAVIMVGGAVLFVNIVEDIGTLGFGTWNDAVSVPAGILLIAWGTNQALLIPAQETGEPDG